MNRLLPAIIASIVLLMFGASPVSAIGVGQNPCGLKWRVIKTEHFKVIYPAAIEKDAQRVAATLEHAYPHVTKTLKFKPKRLSVLLYTQSAESNASAAYMPRRSQWWNTPPQESVMGSNDWYTELAIHEFRHIVQLDSLNRGFNKFLYVVFGEQGPYTMSFLSVPMWFFEGDAVGTETALTASGRGRSPEFDVELRAILLSGKRYPYFKALFGSFDDWDPLKSPYLLGYYMTTHVKRKYGPDVWANMMKRAGWAPFVPHWFDFMLIKETGSSAYSLYNDTMDEMEQLWKKQLDGLAITGAKPLHKTDPYYWTYNNAPQYAPDGSIITLRYGMKDIYSLMRIDPATGKEKRLCYPGKINFTAPSVAGGRVVWSEQVPDLRWGQRSYSAIVVYDLKAKKKRTLTANSKLFAPALSPDGKTVAAVEFTPSNECFLVLIDADTGAELKRFRAPDHEYIQTPHWSTDGKSIVYSKLHSRNGKAIARMDPGTGSSEDIIPYTKLNLSYPVSDGVFIYFVSPYSGIDNIYAVDIATRKIFQVTSRKFGAYYPALSPDGTKLVFNDVTADGYTAVEADINRAAWTPLEKVEDRSIRYYEPLIPQEANGDITGEIPAGSYQSKKFNHFTHLINVHSWLPAVDPLSHDLSFTLSSRNLLGTTEIKAGYNYNWNEKTHAGLMNISYAGLYPIIDAGVLYGQRSSTYDVEYFFDQKEKTYHYQWRELKPTLGLRVPFNLTRSMFDTYLTLGVRGSYTMVWGMDLHSRYFTEHSNHNGSFIPISYYASFYNGYQWFADIHPFLGQVIDVVYSHTPFRGYTSGSLFSVSGTFYFPGILRHHSLFLQGGYESQSPHEYRFESRMLFPRGYDYEFSQYLARGCVNYTFPIFSPDWNLGHVFHFKRFYANLFGDYGAGMEGKPGKLGVVEYYRSAGLELYAEMHFFTIEVPIILGIRGFYRFDQHDDYARPYGFQILFGIGSDFLSMYKSRSFLY